MIFNTTGGGAALNFKVLAYATEEALLAATPAENTIGIITETPITSWIFSATEPSPAAAGMVWITTGTSSSVEFNALKKNGLQVYPISAKQYVGGAWVSSVAMFYQNDEWKGNATELYLFNEGDTCSDITGGWEESYKGGTGSGSGSSSIGSTLYATATVTNDGNYSYETYISHKTPIYVTFHKTLEITLPTVSCSNKNAHFTVGLGTSNKEFDLASSGAWGSSGTRTITIDISSITGKVYVVLAAQAYWYSTSTIAASKVRLLP